MHCRSPPVRQIWSLARRTWPHRNIPWLEINLGTILGCGRLSTTHTANVNNQIRDRNNKTHLKGTSHLLQILISESAYLIWVLRCERVIQEKLHNNQEIKSRWLHCPRARPGPAYFYWPLTLALEGWAKPAGLWPRASSTQGHEGRARAGLGPPRTRLVLVLVL